MLTWLFNNMSQDYSFLNVFRYLTFRGICSVLTAIGIFFIFGPAMIRKLSYYQIGQTVREDGPPTHFSKVGTPTMGGALILISVVVATLLWANLSNRYIWAILFTTISFGLIGWVDDYRKLIDKNPKGMGARNKFIFQSLSGFSVAFFLFYTARYPAETELLVPLSRYPVSKRNWATKSLSATPNPKSWTPNANGWKP